jgi:hypothetical protein
LWQTALAVAQPDGDNFAAGCAEGWPESFQERRLAAAMWADDRAVPILRGQAGN